MKLKNTKINTIISFLLSMAFINAYAIEVVFDGKQKTAKILEINEMGNTYSECSDEYIVGKIYKIDGEYPSIDIYLKSTDGKKDSAATIDLGEMDMVTVKSIDTIVFVGSKVKTYIQRCGSGAIPYLIYIKNLNKN